MGTMTSSPRLLPILPAVALILSSGSAVGGTIDLQVVAPSRVIQGAAASIYAYVANTAPPGSSDLDYSIAYAFPYGTSTLADQVRVAGAGAGAPYVGQLDTAQTGLGPQQTTVTVTDPNATSSPVIANPVVNVVSHAVPLFYVTVTGKPAAIAPDPEPLAFGATGGGEFFAARSSVINDPAIPTAALDLDDILEAGDPQLRAQFYSPTGQAQTLQEFISSFKGLEEIHEASGQSVIGDPLLYEQFGRTFDIFVDTTAPGTFTKTWTFAFSDEDIPGAYSPGALVRTFTMTAVIAPIPLPPAMGLLASAMGVLSMLRRRRIAA